MLHRFREPSETELIYVRTQTQVISRTTLRGALSRDQFQTALAALELRFAILRAVIRDGHFLEKPAERMTPVHWLAGQAVSIDQLYNDLLDRQLNLHEGLYEAHVIDHGDSADIFLLTSHAVTDATALLELHACLAFLCDGAVRGATPNVVDQPFPQSIDDAVARCLTALGIDPAQRRPAADFEGDFLQLPEQADSATGAFTHALARIVLAPARMRLISDAGHAHGVSVHAMLTAAFALAVRDVATAPAPQILMRASIDMRRRLHPHVAVELVFSAVTAHISHVADMSGSIFDIARAIQADIRSGTADGRILEDYVHYPSSFGQMREAPVALNISDMGAVTLHFPMTTLKVAGFEYATGWRKRYPNVSVTIHQGRLVATLTYIPEIISPETMTRLSAGVVAHLDAAAGL